MHVIIFRTFFTLAHPISSFILFDAVSDRLQKNNKIFDATMSLCYTIIYLFLWLAKNLFKRFPKKTNFSLNYIVGNLRCDRLSIKKSLLPTTKTKDFKTSSDRPLFFLKSLYLWPLQALQNQIVIHIISICSLSLNLIALCTNFGSTFKSYKMK